MNNLFLTNYTKQTFLERVRENLRRCDSFCFSVSLAYKDKFIAPNLFQWECENNISDEKLRSLRQSKYAYIFVRKVKEEHGITLPFTYVGLGKLTNERIQRKVDSQTGRQNITYLYDITMNNKLPEKKIVYYYR